MTDNTHMTRTRKLAAILTLATLPLLTACTQNSTNPTPTGTPQPTITVTGDTASTPPPTSGDLINLTYGPGKPIPGGTITIPTNGYTITGTCTAKNPTTTLAIQLTRLDNGTRTATQLTCNNTKKITNIPATDLGATAGKAVTVNITTPTGLQTVNITISKN